MKNPSDIGIDRDKYISNCFHKISVFNLGDNPYTSEYKKVRPNNIKKRKKISLHFHFVSLWSQWRPFSNLYNDNIF